MKPKHEIPWRRHKAVEEKNRAQSIRAEMYEQHQKELRKALDEIHQENLAKQAEELAKSKARRPWWGTPAWSQ